MKIIPNTIIKKHLTPIFLGDFEGPEDIEREFSTNFTSENILVAGYNTGNYEGNAYVLFENNDKLYEVHASHCSCYGLENQWEFEEVVLSELRNRVKKGNGPYLANCNDALKLILGLNEN